MTSTRNHKPRHLVRPREVWGGLGLALLGVGLLGLGMALTSWGWGVPGVVALLAGAVVGVRGGGLYDVHSGSPRAEVRQVLHDQAHEGVGPGDTIDDDRVRRTSRELDQRRVALIRATHEAPRPPLAQLGAIVVLLVATILLFAQWEVYPLGQTGLGNGLRALGAAVVAGLAAFRLLLGQPGRHRLASALVLLAGAALLLQAFLLGHVVGRTVVTEAACGVLVVLGGLAALVSPDRGERV